MRCIEGGKITEKETARHSSLTAQRAENNFCIDGNDSNVSVWSWVQQHQKKKKR